METQTNLRIAVQKSGRLTEKTIGLLEAIGLRFDDYKRSLMVKCRNFDVELLLLRDDDIPEYVQDGVCDLGIVGANVTREKRADVDAIRDLDFGHCRLSLAVPKNGDIKEIKDFEGKRIATSYPNLTEDYLKEYGVTSRLVPISGAVEIAPTLDVADAICDLVSTGGTLRANGLYEMQPIFYSESQLIQTRKELSDKKKDLIDRIIQRMEGQQQAVKSRYIMMNAPEKAIDAIKDILPSAKSPTILPLAEKDLSAIHSVVPIDQFWEIMEQLKEVGASDIVILPVESMII